MDSKLTLFSQIISKIDRVIFKKIVKEKKTDYRNKGFDSWTHFVSMYCILYAEEGLPFFFLFFNIIFFLLVNTCLFFFFLCKAKHWLRPGIFLLYRSAPRRGASTCIVCDAEYGTTRHLSFFLIFFPYLLLLT